MSTVLDFTIQDAIIALVSRGVPTAIALQQVGVHKNALNAMLKHDSDFKDRFEAAIDVMIARVDQTVYNNAVDGDAKFVELFRRQWQPHLVAQPAFGGKAGGQGAVEPGVKVTIEATIETLREVLMSTAAPEFIGLLHQDAIDTTSTESDD